jgi:hypothetical protein
MRLEMMSSLMALSLGGGGQTRLSIMSSVEDFMLLLSSGGSEMEHIFIETLNNNF